MILKTFGINLIFCDKKVFGEINPPEDSEILAENARMKAQYAAEKTGMLALRRRFWSIY